MECQIFADRLVRCAFCCYHRTVTDQWTWLIEGVWPPAKGPRHKSEFTYQALSIGADLVT